MCVCVRWTQQEVYLPSLTVPERNISRIVPEGTYNVTWIFRVNYLSGNGLNARGYLASFRFTGVPDGGGYRCELCPPGSGSPDVGQVTCPTCTPGTYNDATGVRAASVRGRASDGTTGSHRILRSPHGCARLRGPGVLPRPVGWVLRQQVWCDRADQVRQRHDVGAPVHRLHHRLHVLHDHFGYVRLIIKEEEGS